MDPVLTITLNLMSDGQVGIKMDGPGSENKVTVLGVLEFVKHVFLGQSEQQPAAPRVLPGSLLPRLRNGNRGA